MQRFGVVYDYINDENCYVARLLAFDTKHSQKIYELFNDRNWDYTLVFHNGNKIDCDKLYRVLEKYVLTINPDFEELEVNNVPKKKKLTDREMLKIGYGMLEIVDEEVWGPSKNFVELYGEIGGDYRQVRVYRDGSAEG